MTRCGGLFLAAWLAVAGARAGDVLTIVPGGTPRWNGPAWERSGTALAAEGTGRFLFADRSLGAGDFSVTARLTLARLDGSAAAFVLDDSRFGFDGHGGVPFVEGPLFGGAARAPAVPEQRVHAGVAFDFEVVRKDGVTRFLVDGHEVHRLEGWNGAVRDVGLRPWRNRMTVERFEVAGNLVTLAPPAKPEGQPLFTGGSDGYHTYRIPALAVSTAGTVLAFCEGRKNGWGDSGDIDLLLKRSRDGGKTWGAQQIIWDDAGHCCGNPCAVVDRTAGTIWLLSTWNRGDDHEGAIIAGKSKDTRRIFALQSDDDGASWSAPREITAAVKLSNWTWYATGPGSGIQIENGPHRGRLVIPCDHIEADTKRYFSHVIFSNDHGATWQLGGSSPRDRVNECEVVELAGGRLLLNMRNYDRAQARRQVATSDDGGGTWKDQRFDDALVEPICQAAVERLRGSGAILFSNPASADGRKRMTVRTSLDGGTTWPRARVLHEGPSAYSDLAALPDGSAACCLYEAGAENAAEWIVFARLPVEALLPPPPGATRSTPDGMDPRAPARATQQ